MRKSRLISVPLAAILSAAALAGPAAAQDPATSGGRPDVVGNPNVSHRITSHASQLPGPPTWPTDPQPITQYRSSVEATDTGFDWDSAGIGAAASFTILAAGMAGLAGVRRRRHARPQTLTSS